MANIGIIVYCRSGSAYIVLSRSIIADDLMYIENLPASRNQCPRFRRYLLGYSVV